MMYVANAGDSRTLLCTGGKPFALSIDHKPDDEIEFKRITAAGGFITDGRINGNLNLSRCIGDFEYKKDDVLSQKE
jgi:protein phosphatase 1G